MLTTEKGRIGLIHEMREAYKEQYYFENGIAEVLRRHGCADERRAARQAEGTKCRPSPAGRSCSKRRSIPSIIGGIVVKVNNEQFDTEPAHSPQRDRRSG